MGCRWPRDFWRPGLFDAGVGNGDMIDFEGTALQLPGVAFKAVLTRIGDQSTTHSLMRVAAISGAWGSALQIH
jgi:hypothetical protein